MRAALLLASAALITAPLASAQQYDGAGAASEIDVQVESTYDVGATAVAGGNAYAFQPWFAALMYQVSGDVRYAIYAVQQTDALVAAEEALISANQRAGVAGDSYLEVGAVIGNLDIVYDWCHAHAPHIGVAASYVPQHRPHAGLPDPHWPGSELGCQVQGVSGAQRGHPVAVSQCAGHQRFGGAGSARGCGRPDRRQDHLVRRPQRHRAVLQCRQRWQLGAARSQRRAAE